MQFTQAPAGSPGGVNVEVPFSIEHAVCQCQAPIMIVGIGKINRDYVFT